MKTDKFTRGCLIAIAVLLAMLLVKPFFEAKVTYAGKGVEYKVISGMPPQVIGFGVRHRKTAEEWREYTVGAEQGLNQYAKEGWELVHYDESGIAILKR